MPNVKSGFYRSGQAAKLWGISTHLVRRLSEEGLIHAERTDSGQWKIPYSEVKRIKTEGIPEIPSSITNRDCQQQWEDNSSSERSPKASHSQGLAGGFSAAGSAAEWLAIETGDEAQSNSPRIPQTSEAHAQPRPSASALSTGHVRAERERIDWHDSWIATALRSVPPEAPPEVSLSVRELVTDILENLGPQHSWWVIDPLVRAGVAKALRPWTQKTETARAITMACDSLPLAAKGLVSPTIWQSRAREAASTVINKMPPDAAFVEKLSAGSGAVREVTLEFEDHELRNMIVRLAYLGDVAGQDHENAKEAIRGRLAGLSAGTHALAMENAREQALIPFRESRKRKARVDQALGRIRGYLQQLYNEGEIEFESTWAVWDFARRLEGRLRPVVEQELVDDDLSDRELVDLVEELVDEELE